MHAGRPVAVWGADRGAARVAVVAVHGRGQTPEFMYEASRSIGADGVRFYAPHAHGDSWYPEPFMVPVEKNEPDLAFALESLRACTRDVGRDGFDHGRVVLWGFSQGACLVSQLVVTGEERVGGIVVFTGGYIGDGPAPAPVGTAVRGVPVVVRSVEHDPWVPAERVRETARLLTALGADVDLRIDPGNDHVVTAEARRAAGRLLARVSR
ncbi:MAG: phospholipase [Pseudonocardia sp. SCN 72-86]|nr:MAG: phospholipase [Pseudonocardia sp. SCN 72-86]